MTKPNNRAEFHGVNAPNLREILVTRRDNGYKPGSFSDGHQLALLFEGGAMRGLISCASGVQLERMGFGDCFDFVYGTSAGAFNAAYFTAGQAERALKLYFNEIAGDEFMGIWRWPDQVDVRWLANRIRKNPDLSLDTQTLVKSPIHLQIPATNTQNGVCRFFSNHNDPEDWLIPSLSASASTPIFVTHQTEIGGEFYNDGVIGSPLNSRKAIKDGATHLMALLCNPVGRVKKNNIFRQPLEQLIRIRKYAPEYQRAYHMRSEIYNAEMDALHQLGHGVDTLVICPHKSDIVPKRLEKNHARMTTIAKTQFDRVQAIMGFDPDKRTYKPV